MVEKGIEEKQAKRSLKCLRKLSGVGMGSLEKPLAWTGSEKQKEVGGSETKDGSALPRYL